MRNWRNLSYKIYGSEVRIVGIISHSLVSNKSKVTVRKELIRELARVRSTVKLTESEANRLWHFSQYFMVRVGNMDKKASNSEKYLRIRRLLPTLESFKHQLIREIETREKNAYLGDLLSDGIFYLCSFHKDCAADHLDYQGKIYVSEDWEARCMDYDRKKIAAYIKNHDVQTVEWVLGEPVYMTTRPNCRHYFVQVGVEEVLHNSVKKLLKANDLISDSGEKTNAYYTYREYYERLRMLLELRNSVPCLELEEDIKRTRILIRKWATEVNKNG